MAIYKRGKTWTCQISWRGYQDGKRKRFYKTKGGFKTKALARQWQAEHEVLKSKGKLSNRNPVFVKYFKWWYETFRTPGLQPNTIHRYIYAEGVAQRFLGNIKIGDITRPIYQQFLNDYGKDHAFETVGKTIHLLNSCLQYAYDDGLVSSMFFKYCHIVYDKTKKRHVEYLSMNEIHELVKELTSKMNPRYTSRFAILTSIYTGMRLGEILALRWSDIDKVKQTINVTRSYDYKTKTFKEPKTPQSKRTIRVNQFLLDKLTALYENRSELVFAHKDGSLPSEEAVNKCLKAVMKKAGIVKHDFSFHSLRHCYVAYMYAAGHVSWYKISKTLGHSSVAFTMQRYSYLINEMSASEDVRVANTLNTLNP